ncbi:hypothetical protein FRIGORI9N_60017 [Frigoribacterium sp. 9N]|nr:hypothetical protein FRIGORI9N_60017 [Frigoribacterium sp. 9N]
MVDRLSRRQRRPYAAVMSPGVKKYKGRARLALISAAAWLAIFVAFAVLDAQTDLNGFTGMGLGTIFTAVNVALFIYAQFKLRSAKQRELHETT